MKFSYYDTDMAADSLEKNSLSEIADVKELSHGIVRRTANLRSKELADKIGRGRGVYVTFDCPLSVFDKEKSVSTLTEYIASSLVGMAGVQGKSARVLAVGLGVLGHLCATGATGHCFVGQNGRPVSLKKKLPEIFELFCSIVSAPEN